MTSSLRIISHWDGAQEAAAHFIEKGNYVRIENRLPDDDGKMVWNYDSALREWHQS